MGLSILFVAILAIAAASTLTVALISWRRPAPGSVPFRWLMLAIAFWCVLSALHSITQSVSVRVLWAKAQYLAIASVPVLWLLFTLDYGRWRRVSGWRLAALAAIPLLTVGMAWTNEWHRWLWSSIVPASAAPGARLVYHYGPWFWLAATYNYVLLLYGTVVLARALALRPPPFRRQSIALLVGALIPWIGNVVYLTGLIPIPGLDITPLAFAASGLICAWGLYRYRMFDLVPAARDSVIDNMSDVVIVLDRNQRVMDANPAAAQIFGCPPAQLVGKTMREIRPHYHDLLAAHSTSEEANAEIVLSLASESRYYERRSAPIHDTKARLIGQLVVLRDITDQKQAAAALQQATEHAALANQAQSVFLATMSHELRTPLTTILGYCDLLQLKAQQLDLSERSADAERIQHDIERIHAAGTHLLTLISSILDLSAIEAGQQPLTHEIFDVPEQLAMIQRMLGPLFEQRDNQLVIDCPADFGVLQTDLTKLRQILFNLLSNATKFTQLGTISLQVERLRADQVAPEMLPETAKAESSWIQFSVSDTGIGMTDAQMQKLFQPYSQADAMTSQQYGGTGLGLAISRQFCQLMGGDLSVRSTPGQGTTFTMLLPVVGPTPEPAPRWPSAAAGQHERGGDSAKFSPDTPVPPKPLPGTTGSA